MKNIVAIVILSLVFLGGVLLTWNAGSKTINKKQDAIIIKDYKFSPSAITVKKGTKITWVNRDTAKHNVAIEGEDLNGPAGPLIRQNQTYTYTFTETGSYEYHCDPHPYMKGIVKVTE